MLQTEYTIIWGLWLLILLLVEAAALRNKKKGDTLSEHIWKWFSIKERGAMWRWRRGALLAILAWILVHLLSGGAF